MTVELLFVQGGGAGAHVADRLLADGLTRALGVGFRVHFPAMPDEADPDPALWKTAIADALARTRAAVLVAHSAGAAIVADMLAQCDQAPFEAVRGVLLLAPPYVGEGGWSLPGFHLDDPISPPTAVEPPLLLLFGSADQTVPLDHAALYAGRFPRASIHRLGGGDHQFGGFMPRVAKAVRALLHA